MPDLLSNFDALTTSLVGAFAFLAAVAGFFRWVRPGVRALVKDFRAGRDALVGRDAIHDTITGREIVPALPGIGVRMDTTENQMKQLATALATLVDNSHRLDDLEPRVTKLEEAAVERVVARAESASAWRAIEAVAAQSTSAVVEPVDPELGLGDN